MRLSTISCALTSPRWPLELLALTAPLEPAAVLLALTALFEAAARAAACLRAACFPGTRLAVPLAVA
eukprot:scaffold48_cov60-Phaeocystis_antarctica.AAC.3